jgi:hypothetical protein
MSILGVDFHRASEVRDWPNATPDWIVEDFLAAETATSLSGFVKVGKTTFLTHLVASSLQGRPFLGRRTRRCPWVYLTEQSPPTFQESLRQAGLENEDDLHIVFWAEAMDLSWPEVMEQVAEKCYTLKAALVIDTFPQFARIPADQENASGASYEAMQPIQAAMASGVPIVLSRHDRKSGGPLGEAERGSGATSGIADILLSLRRLRTDDGGPRRELLGLSRFSSTPSRLIIDRTVDGYRVVEGAAPAALDDDDLAKVGSRILEVLGEQSMTEANIRSKAGHTQLAADALRRLRDLGLVERAGAGRKGDPYTYRKGRSDSRSIVVPEQANGRSENSRSPYREKSLERDFSQNDDGAKAGTSNGHAHVDEAELRSLTTVGAPLEVAT